MDEKAGKTAQLVNGSVYDLAAMYIVLIDGESISNPTLIRAFGEILDNGYTYKDVRDEILRVFHSQDMFPFYRFKKLKSNGNILKHGTRYFHKELNIMSEVAPVSHDIDTGVITSGGSEYWIEPRASYTIDDLMSYIYSKCNVDSEEYHPNRMRGLMKNYVNQYGIEVTLFMVEHAVRVQQEEENEHFSLKKFDTYRPFALGYLEQIKNNCVYSGGLDYVPRKRMLLS